MLHLIFGRLTFILLTLNVERNGKERNAFVVEDFNYDQTWQMLNKRSQKYINNFYWWSKSWFIVCWVCLNNLVFSRCMFKRKKYLAPSLANKKIDCIFDCFFSFHVMFSQKCPTMLWNNWSNLISYWVNSMHLLQKIARNNWIIEILYVWRFAQ